MPQSKLAFQIGIHLADGGEGRVISELAKFLPRVGFNVMGAVAEPRDVRQQTQGQFVNFSPPHASKFRRFTLGRSTLIDCFSKVKPDIVDSHFALYSLPALDQLKTRPFVTHFHGPWGEESAQDGAGRVASSGRKAIEKLVYGASARIIVLSQAFADLAQTSYGVRSDLVRVVPGSVDVDRFSPTMTRSEARAELALPRDRPLLFCVRRLVRRMGLFELLSAIKIVQRRLPDILLCIAGRGPNAAMLKERVKDLELAENVRLLGFVSDTDLPTYYRAADLSLVPTLALEGFGLVALESLAAGTPSLVSRVGGLPEVVNALSPNLIFPSLDTEALAETICTAILGDLPLPSSEECTEYTRRHFNSTLMAERTAAVYRELL